MGMVAGLSVSEPAGVGGSAVLGAGRGGGGMDSRWFPPMVREVENVLTCCSDEFVVATLPTLETILGNVFCDREDERLGERSGSGTRWYGFCHGGDCERGAVAGNGESGGGVRRGGM